jgi:transcriptional regulator with XRE-family HTH domain
MLARLGISQDAIADELGVTQEAVHYWLAGEKKPAQAKREILELTYAIPVVAWNEKPEPVAVPRIPDFSPDDEVTVADLAAKIQRQAQRSIYELETDPNVTPLERDKRLGALTTIINRLRDRELSNGDIVRAPATRRVLDTIITALQPFPGALEACAKALMQFEQEGP